MIRTRILILGTDVIVKEHGFIEFALRKIKDQQLPKYNDLKVYSSKSGIEEIEKLTSQNTSLLICL